jgi:CHAT domain-containing protein
VRRAAATVLLLLVAGCAGTDAAPPRETRGRHASGRAAPSLDRGASASLPAWEAAQARVRRGEAAAVLTESQRNAAAAEAAGDLVAAGQEHTAAAYAAVRLGRFDVGVREARAAVTALQARSDWIWADLVMARAHRFGGMAERQLGHLPEAQRELDAALAHAQVARRGRPHPPMTANIYASLAGLADARGDRAAGIRYAEESVKTIEADTRGSASARPSRRQLASSQVELALRYLRADRVDEAASLAASALSNARGVGLPDVEVSARGLVAQIAARRGDPKAPALFAEALEGAQRNKQVGLQVTLYNTLARTHAAQGRPAEALESYRRALDVVESIRAQLEDADVRSSFFESKQEIYQSAVRVALGLGQGADAFALAERSRARAFLDLLGTHTTLSKGRTQSLASEELRLRARLAAARGGEVEDDGAEGSGDAAVAAAERAYGEFLSTVRATSGEQAALMSVEPVTAAEVQALLAPDTTLLEYLVTPGETFVWVVDRARVEVVRIRARRQEVLAEVRDFRKAIADLAPPAEVEQRGEALYRRLIAPVRHRVQGDRVVIVPHDVLHYLPFAALRSPEGRWLVEDWRLSTVPSASVLKYLGEKGTSSRGPAVAIGNPELGPELSLRFAEREAQAVAAALPGAQVFVRGQATEHEAKHLAPTASVLHFATHAVLEEKDPLTSALLLVGGGGEDGRLEVRELFGMDLRARLVVLSACETGLGHLSRGDELVGLQRAFLYAGTPTVVTTLWKVDDRASFVLMRRFYEALAANGPAEALRRAQRASLVDAPHPFFWAAFGLSGDPR